MAKVNGLDQDNNSPLLEAVEEYFAGKLSCKNILQISRVELDYVGKYYLELKRKIPEITVAAQGGSLHTGRGLVTADGSASFHVFNQERESFSLSKVSTTLNVQELDRIIELFDKNHHLICLLK